MNLIVRHHNRAAYPLQVLRDVAEQIYELYWESGEPDLDVRGEGSTTLERGADLKDHNNILELPEEWPDDGDADGSGLEKFAETTRLALLPSLQL